MIVLMIVFGIQCNFFIVLPIRLETCRYNAFSSLKRQNVRARKIGHVSDVLRAKRTQSASGVQFVQASSNFPRLLFDSSYLLLLLFWALTLFCKIDLIRKPIKADKADSDFKY